MQSVSRQCIEICIIKKVHCSCYFSLLETPLLLLWTTSEFCTTLNSVLCFSMVILTITVLSFLNLCYFIVSNTEFIHRMPQVEIISLALRLYSLLHYICFDRRHMQKSSSNVGDWYFKNCFCTLPGRLFFSLLTCYSNST